MALCSGNPPVTGQRWIPNTKDQSNNANLRWLLYCHIEQTVECPVKWDAFALMWRHLNATGTRSNESQQNAWWRHQMETFFALLALCAGNSPVPVNSPHKGQWRGALMFSLICSWINDWVNNREAGDLRRHRGYYDVSVMGIREQMLGM